MKKDKIYCLRMNSTLHEALRLQAASERRSLASLFDKILFEYMERHELIPEAGRGAEQRKFPRTRVTMPATCTLKSGSKPKAFPCVLVNISLGGVLIMYPKGSDINLVAKGRLPSFKLSFQVPQTAEVLRFACQARHISEGDTGFHVGAMFDHPPGEDLNKLQQYFI